MRFHGFLVGFLVVAAMLGAGLRAQAAAIPPGYEALTYNVTLNNGVNGVSQFVFEDQTTIAADIGSSWGYSLSSGSSSVTQLWPTSFESITATFGLGLVTNLPGDPVGAATTHLAVFGNFTAGEVGESFFSTLFPDANENVLIYDLTNIFVSPPNGALIGPAVATDIRPLFNDANNLGLFIVPGGNFDVVAFTDGQLIGTGTSEVTIAPEPASFLLLGSGILALWAAFKLKAICKKAQQPA